MFLFPKKKWFQIFLQQSIYQTEFLCNFFLKRLLKLAKYSMNLSMSRILIFGLALRYVSSSDFYTASMSSVCSSQGATRILSAGAFQSHWLSSQVGSLSSHLITSSRDMPKHFFCLSGKVRFFSMIFTLFSGQNLVKTGPKKILSLHLLNKKGNDKQFFYKWICKFSEVFSCWIHYLIKW